MSGQTLTRSTDHWHAALADEFGGLTVADRSGHPAGVLRAAHLGEVGAFTVRGTPQTLRRTSRAARLHGSDSVKVCAVIAGRAILTQGDRELVAGPGTLIAYDIAKPYELRLDERWSCAVMTVSRQALELPPRRIARILERPHDIRTGAGPLLVGFIVSAAAVTSGIDRHCATLVGDAGVRLATAVLDTGTSARNDGTPAIRDRALVYIRDNARDPALGVATVAAALHVSPRTLQRQFEGYETSVSETIRTVRLEGVRRDLTDARFTDRTIAAIAARWCFLDAAGFCRAFRARYGTTPSATRTAGRRSGA